MPSHGQGYVDPNWPSPGGPQDATVIIYGYVPALALGVIAVVFFAIGTLIHSVLLFRYKTWYFTPLLIGTLMEIGGYIPRLLSSQVDPYRVDFFVAQYFLIVVAPVLFSAAIYTMVSVMVNRYGREYSPLPPKMIIWIFVVCDVIATVIQVAGAALVGVAYSNRKDPTTPNNILMAGLAVQVFTFAVFLGLFALVLWRARKSPVKIPTSFKLGLLLATLAVYLRTCFRLAETVEGAMSYLFSHEAYFGALEFAPMVIAVYALAYWHPGRCLGRTTVDELTKSEEGREFQGINVHHSK
ncbi:RTA1-domain-containing protein [Polychaeton citri CBS 116435]|uniref:RTA1-domain-containing protein n=1 Tax=Polychaeton citri CBS 116435 TaxID=1314669 RepID=A0A9P4UJT4_9PEZI|nr:RTA1-domain-containing protein [Polychaeton citri CBS 116435]